MTFWGDDAPWMIDPSRAGTPIGMAFDPRHWNLFAGAVIAGMSACGIPPESGAATEDGVGESATDGSPTSGDDGHGDGYDDGWGDGCGEPANPSERCSPPEDGGYGCYDWKCPFSTECDRDDYYDDSCKSLEPIQDCLPTLDVLEIPVVGLPPGALHVVEGGAGEPDTLLNVTETSLWSLQHGEPPLETLREVQTEHPTDLDLFDWDDDGTAELLISDAAGNVVLHEFDEGTETVLPLNASSLAFGQIEPDGPVLLLYGLNGMVSLVDPKDPSFEIRWSRPGHRAAEEGWVAGVPGISFTRQEAPSGLFRAYLREGTDRPYDESLDVAMSHVSVAGRMGRLVSPASDDSITAMSDGELSRIAFVRDEPWARWRGVVPGDVTAADPTFSQVGPDKAVFLPGVDASAALLVDGLVGFVCVQSLPGFLTFVRADLDGDGEDELYGQHPDGSIAELVIE